MKQYTKIALLVALALFLTLTACTRTASTSPVRTPTTAGDVPFPVDTVTTGVLAFGTQTAIAANPAQAVPTNTPEVLVATVAPVGQDVTAAQPTATLAAPSNPATSGQVVNTPIPAGPRPATYALQNGEWPICIARRYGLDIAALFQLNGLTMNSKPSAGAVLKIPATGNWNATYGQQALVQHPATYTVAAGDTVYTIACRYGNVDPAALMTANNLAKPTDIKVGQALQIP